MDTDFILSELTFSKRLPIEAIQAAEADREAVVAAFLKTIEDYADEGAEAASEPSPLFVIFHLLGGWREKAAYRPLVRLLRCSHDALDNALGDALTESAQVVMAAVFDGDPEPLYELILDAKADKFARSGMFDALVILAVNGDLPRAEVERFLRLCPSRLEPGTAWFGRVGRVPLQCSGSKTCGRSPRRRSIAVQSLQT